MPTNLNSTKQRIIKVQVVEPQMIVATDIVLQLLKLGYGVFGIQKQAESVVFSSLKDDKPDLYLINISLHEKIDGISLAMKIRAHYNTPVVLFGSVVDENTRQQISAFDPHAFIHIPFNMRDVKIALATATDRIDAENYCHPD